MKKAVFIFVCIITSLLSYSQDSTYKWYGTLGVGSEGKQDVSNMLLDVSLGLNLNPKFGLELQLLETYTDDIRDVDQLSGRSELLGLGCLWNFRTLDNGNILYLKVSGGHSIYSRRWDRSYLGLSLGGLERSGVCAEIGTHYYGADKSGYLNCWMFYGKLSFRFHD